MMFQDYLHSALLQLLRYPCHLFLWLSLHRQKGRAAWFCSLQSDRHLLDVQRICPLSQQSPSLLCHLSLLFSNLTLKHPLICRSSKFRATRCSHLAQQTRHGRSRGHHYHLLDRWARFPLPYSTRNSLTRSLPSLAQYPCPKSPLLRISRINATAAPPLLYSPTPRLTLHSSRQPFTSLRRINRLLRHRQPRCISSMLM